MTELRLERVDVAYGSNPVVRAVTLTVERGACLAVLGPSGCGKSTLLRAIAGIEPLTGGSVSVGGRDLAGVATHRRGIGLMFQDHALFPHMSVAGNVGYGLRMANWDRNDAAARVAAMLAAVGLRGRGDEAVTELSGGEQQRVALARTLAPRPPVVLLDEPLGSLDRALREELLTTMSNIFQSDGTTVVYVTHDHGEAFELGDQVAVMSNGELVQVASPLQLWAQPATAWVARFLGLANIVSRDAAGALLTATEVAAMSGTSHVLIRPDRLRLLGERAAATHLDGVAVPVRVMRVAFRGETAAVTVRPTDQLSPHSGLDLEVWSAGLVAAGPTAPGDLRTLIVPADAVIPMADQS